MHAVNQAESESALGTYWRYEKDERKMEGWAEFTIGPQDRLRPMVSCVSGLRGQRSDRKPKGAGGKRGKCFAQGLPWVMNTEGNPKSFPNWGTRDGGVTRLRLGCQYLL